MCRDIIRKHSFIRSKYWRIKKRSDISINICRIIFYAFSSHSIDWRLRKLTILMNVLYLSWNESTIKIRDITFHVLSQDNGERVEPSINPWEEGFPSNLNTHKSLDRAAMESVFSFPKEGSSSIPTTVSQCAILRTTSRRRARFAHSVLHQTPQGPARPRIASTRWGSYNKAIGYTQVKRPSARQAAVRVSRSRSRQGPSCWRVFRGPFAVPPARHPAASNSSGGGEQKIVPRD